MRSSLKRRLLWALGALALAAVALVAIGLVLVDTPAVQAEVQRRLSAALQGQVTWQSLDIGLLPAPHAELTRVRVDIPDKLSASADEAKVYLRLWPLLRGRPEISSVVLARPQVRITPSGESRDAPLDAVALYRAAVEPLARGLREFAPDMTLKLEQASVEVGSGFALRELRASASTDAKGVALDGSAASNFWKRLSVDGRIEYADLSARARVELDGLEVDKDVPPAQLRAQLQTDGKNAIEGDFFAATGTLAAAKGKLVLAAGKPPALAAQINNVDLAQALALARLKVSGLDAIEAAEGRLSARADFTLDKPWQLHLEVVGSDAAVKLAALPWKVAAGVARVTITPGQVRVAGAKGSVGDSPFENVSAQVDLGSTPRLSAASGNASLQLEQWFPWLKTKAPLDDIASLSGSVDVALARLALRFDRPAEVDFEASATPQKVSAALKMLPAPVSVTGGSVQAGPKQIVLTRVGVVMLDARALVSGTVGIQKPAIELAVAEGSLGEKLVRWALERGAVPPRFEPKTPLRFAAQRIAWAPKGALEVDARVDFPGGPAVAAALAWRPELLELRRLAIKDAASDAVLSATVADDLIQGGFSGRLQGRSVAAMLRQPPPSDSGSAQGELRFTIDQAQPYRSAAEGQLRVEALDLSWLAGRRAIVERIDLSAGKTSLRIVEARLDVEEQRFNLRGEMRRTGAIPVIEARIESAGVVLDRLLPPPDPNAPKKPASAIWPLPVSGRIDVASGFVQYKEYKIEPFAGDLVLEPQRARLEVKEARMCGVSFPLEVEARPDDTAAWAHIRMKDQPLERTVRCLTGGSVELTGSADLTAELQTQGRRPHLLRDMTGTLQADVRQGRVKKFALLGNILSFRGIAALDKKEDGFPYRRMTAKGHFQGGALMLEEAFFDSDAVRLAASGRVDLLEPHSQLTVLVGLLTNVDRIAGAIPIVGDIFGGSMTALPMSVSGDLRDPLIVPLGPRAVTDQLLGIFERTLKLPGKLLVPAEAKPSPP